MKGQSTMCLDLHIFRYKISPRFLYYFKPQQVDVLAKTGLNIVRFSFSLRIVSMKLRFFCINCILNLLKTSKIDQMSLILRFDTIITFHMLCFETVAVASMPGSRYSDMCYTLHFLYNKANNLILQNINLREVGTVFVVNRTCLSVNLLLSLNAQSHYFR